MNYIPMYLTSGDQTSIKNQLKLKRETGYEDLYLVTSSQLHYEVLNIATFNQSTVPFVIPKGSYEFPFEATSFFLIRASAGADITIFPDLSRWSFTPFSQLDQYGTLYSSWLSGMKRVDNNWQLNYYNRETAASGGAAICTFIDSSGEDFSWDITSSGLLVKWKQMVGKSPYWNEYTMEAHSTVVATLLYYW